MTKRAPETSRKTLAPSLRSAIDPFVVMDVMRQANARQAAGGDIIHMEVGQPGTPAPRLVREVVEREIGRGPLGYTDALGLPDLRQRIARHYREAHNLDISPARVVVTTGSSAGFVLAFLGLLDPGDAIALPQPGYPCYRQIARVLGLKPISLQARAESRFMPTPEDVSLAFGEGGARAILLASPSNPTGAMLSAPIWPAWSTLRKAGSSPMKSITASPIPARRRRRCPSRRRPSSLIVSRNTIP